MHQNYLAPDLRRRQGFIDRCRLFSLRRLIGLSRDPSGQEQPKTENHQFSHRLAFLVNLIISRRILIFFSMLSESYPIELDNNASCCEKIIHPAADRRQENRPGSNLMFAQNSPGKGARNFGLVPPLFFSFGLLSNRTLDFNNWGQTYSLRILPWRVLRNE